MDFNFKIETFQDSKYKVVDYIPFPKQLEIHEKFKSGKYNIVRKSRAMGLTTTIKVEAAERLLGTPNYKIGYVTHMSRYGMNFIDSLKNIISTNIGIDYINKWGRPALELTNGSSIRLINSFDSLRGVDYDWIIFDDMFSMEKIVPILDSVMTMDCDITLVATPTIGYNPFKRYYFGAMTNSNRFVATDYLWYDHPAYSQDIEWVRGNVRIDDSDDGIQKIRLLEFGFHRESKTYDRHLKMFGMEYISSFEDFETYSNSSY